ncbi:MAG TPA: ThiF family adenylyltransferase [Polyangiaceae bacterium]|nr:ThiF family adenylyltransferase [Polyangiaceae bacterium]
MKRPRHRHQPLVIPAEAAHSERLVQYADDGSVSFRHPALAEAVGSEQISIAPSQQFPCVFATFMDLSKALSSNANSPRLESGSSLREEFDREFARYRELVARCRSEGRWEPDYGSYVLDPASRRLYLVAPEYWHRLALTTSAGGLLLDPERKLHWRQVRQRLERAVVGVVGVSVGSNVVEALCRELRPRQLKLADPDCVELTNLNRLERVGFNDLVAPRSARRDARNAFEMIRCNKAELTAHRQNLVDPYAEFFVYPTGVDEQNIDRFLLGDGGEPKLDLVVEEADDISLKVSLRRRCRELGIPVLMMSDFGHVVASHFQDFARDPKLPIAYASDDTECQSSLERCLTTGNRDDLFDFVHRFVGSDCMRDEFAQWIAGEGEQPTSSLPQSGATAMVAGGLAGKLVARYFLGHPLPPRAIHDLAQHSLEVDAQRRSVHVG